MHRTAAEHRREFDELGYTVFEGVLVPAEIDAAVEKIDCLLSFDSRPPLVTGGTDHSLNGRRQLARTNCEPYLANLGTHPRVVEAMERIIGGPVSLMMSPIPASTFKSAPGGERFEWGYHVDWLHTPPSDEDLRVAFGVLHLSRIDTGGGAFMVIPRSHRLVEAALRDPPLRERAFKQDFEHFPSLGERVEMRVRAGDMIVYHPLLVHDRSENLLDQPRKVVFVHYQPARGPRDPSEIAKAFHADHLASMDPRTRRLCGIE
jgi:ectoine hydroxylase-related dioxygenase (phytanoyl-CoA dioxygenase family)